jgi:tetratricopeptide (TPR) repeat protein
MLGYNLIRKKVVLIIVFLLILSNTAALKGQDIDVFYKDLVKKAEKSMYEGHYFDAVEKLKIAVFGLYGDKSLAGKAYVLLGLSHYCLKNKEECRLNLEQAEELLGERGFENLALEEYFALDLKLILIDLKFAGYTKPEVEVVSITELEKAIKSKPYNSDAYYRLFNSYQDSNNSKQALKVLKKLVKKNPKEAHAYYLMGHLQYEKKKYKNAQKFLEKFFLKASEMEINNKEITAGWAYLILSVFHRGNKEHTEKLASVAKSFLSEREIRTLSLTEIEEKHLQRIIRAVK